MTLSWTPHVYPLLLAEDFPQIISAYEQAIKTEPENRTHYWYLGLAYLLNRQEESAQTAWLVPMLTAEEQAVEQGTLELADILETEAQRLESLGKDQQNWLVRGHLRELVPNNLHNLLKFLQVTIKIQAFHTENLKAWNISEHLQVGSPLLATDQELLLEVLRDGLNQLLGQSVIGSEIIDFVKFCLSLTPQSQFLLPVIKVAASRAYYLEHQPFLAIDLATYCLSIAPQDLSTIKDLFYFHVKTGNFDIAVEFAKQYYAQGTTLPLQVFGNYMLMQSLLITGGRWQEAIVAVDHQKSLLLELLQAEDLLVENAFSLIASPLLLNYVQDDLPGNRQSQNQLTQFCEKNLWVGSRTEPKPFQHKPYVQESSTRPLRIGYISHCLRQHSVGWLSRWIFKYHNHDAFHISLYLFNQAIESFTQKWFIEPADAACRIENPNALAVAQRIAADGIDILIDLESVTHTDVCNVMAFKPAPVQVTWLGADASGVSTIDYFMADPYVLPDNAQDHYQETLWRLPHTYVAVDGFEVDIPTRRRDHLGISADAIVYLSVQTGHKRHPDLARLQLQILREVPNSYFLVKGYGDNLAVQGFFIQLADEVGVNPERLKFLPPDPTEQIHRANLQIADVVLDTYPYNGATTTLEVLWMGIPLVTRVGQQFSARNSYTFMTNAGLTEGIAWTDDAYIDWGVKFGRDSSLRQQVTWKLKAARQSSPLWNAQQFTREMEQAYQQMWRHYREQQ
ncbi:hypothetical protein DO97_03830 [Neosynechococcus sphagnicola sy1]|uniref:O-GlcNAc transferase C-terminal domain-containing protein n=1 Tax=Neosynechococcus sphagnicola sy1 TaxID=1497020 RepID=A0A098TKQ0_9CYAN|nr:hypothetical protein [Neosynechococcus sphagnicola]KGF72861.1 hypothetical protein DO97_03830 [Neosynechococcus sphagnicola sy1]